MKKEQAIDKVKKLFSLSESSNENEASMALAQAEKFMRKYSIEQIDLCEKTDITEKDYLKCRQQTWERIIASSVANLFFCVSSSESYFCKDDLKRKKKHNFVGLKTNIQTCEEVYLRLSEWIKLRAVFAYPGKGNTYERNRYKEGIAAGIHKRCCDIIEERRSSKMSTALISLDKEIDEYTKDYGTGKIRQVKLTNEARRGLSDSENAPLFINVNI